MKTRKLRILSGVLLHIPAGILAAWFLLTLPLLGIVFSLGFLVYEVVEHWAILDQAHIDIAGFLVGLAAGGVLFQMSIVFTPSPSLPWTGIPL